jgi:L-threonylcarbamoyladenylate synthase
MAETGTDISKTARLLLAGENIAIPTETVYGLAGIISSEKAIRRIFEIKNRPFSDPLIVHVASIEAIRPLVKEIPQLAEKLLEAFSPGPLTILFKKSDLVPDLVTNASPLVAIRIPAHPICRKLLETVGEPIAAPSANPFGGISPTTPAHVQAGLGAKIPYILDGGECKVGLESTIVKILHGNRLQVLRQGGISEEELLLFAELSSEAHSDKPVVPGSMLSHYAPRKPLFLDEKNLPFGKAVYLRFQNLKEGIPAKDQQVLSDTGNLQEAAKNLFAAMHKLDSLDADIMVAEYAPDKGLGKAINDRLQRASAKSA